LATENALGQARARHRRAPRARRKAAAFYAFISPWLVGFVLLGVVPLVVGFLTSMTNYDGLNIGNHKLLWFRNYARAFRDVDARWSLTRTLTWTGLNTPLWIAASFALALVLQQDVKGRGVFRTIFYLPTIMPTVATMWTWKILLDKNYGLLNGLISLFRPNTALPWLTQYAIYGLTAIGVWSGLGWGMVVFLAGLQDIPDELVEAARIDGANRWQVFCRVTIPLTTPVIFFVLINGLISAFQQFILPMLLTRGIQYEFISVPRSVYLYMIHTYRQMFTYRLFGYGMALLWILIVIIVALTVVLFRTSRHWVYYAVDIEGKEA
jgi:multiple sugar transport system permease protein